MTEDERDFVAACLVTFYEAEVRKFYRGSIVDYGDLRRLEIEDWMVLAVVSEQIE